MAWCLDEYRKKHVYIAKIAEQAQRYNDVMVAMKKVAKLHEELTMEERKLLFDGYKYTVESWRVYLQMIEDVEKTKGNMKNACWINQYKLDLGDFLSNICRKADHLIDKHLILSYHEKDSSKFYRKMKGDCFLYFAGLNTGHSKIEVLEKSLKSYQARRNYEIDSSKKRITIYTLVRERDREELVCIAMFAKQAQRYDEMVDAMKKLAMIHIELTLEERYLLFDGYKKLIEAGRVSLQLISSIELKEEAKGNAQHVKWIWEYRQEVELALSKICNNVLCVIDEHLIPWASSVESLKFYNKIKSDFYWHLAEFKTENDKVVAIKQSLKAYQQYENEDADKDMDQEWDEDGDEYLVEGGDEYSAEDGDRLT